MKKNFFLTIFSLLLLSVIYMEISKQFRSGYFVKISKSSYQVSIANATDIAAISPIALSFAVSIVKNNPNMFIVQLGTFIVANVVCQVIKVAVDEQRPDDPNDYKSFPSGHTTLAFSGAVILLTTIKKTARKKRKTILLCILVLLLAIFTAIGRVLAHRHWPIDVICGGLLGIMCSYACLVLAEKHRTKLEQVLKTLKIN